MWPKFNRDGQFCITFDYHMFGFHINELQLAKNTPNGQIIHWSRQEQKGNMWLEAEANVYLTSSDQVRMRQQRPHLDRARREVACATDNVCLCLLDHIVVH